MDEKPRRGSPLALITSSLVGQVPIVAGVIALILASVHLATTSRGVATAPRPTTPAAIVPMEYAALSPSPAGPSRDDVALSSAASQATVNCRVNTAQC